MQNLGWMTTTSFIYYNQSFIVICKKEHILYSYHWKINCLIFLALHSPFCLFYQKKITQLNSILPESFAIYYSWCNHEMRITMVHSNIKNAKFTIGYSQVYCIRTIHSSVLVEDEVGFKFTALVFTACSSKLKQMHFPGCIWHDT